MGCKKAGYVGNATRLWAALNQERAASAVGVGGQPWAGHPFLGCGLLQSPLLAPRNETMVETLLGIRIIPRCLGRCSVSSIHSPGDAPSMEPHLQAAAPFFTNLVQARSSLSLVGAPQTGAEDLRA